jgi:hypothetical protein
VTVLFHAPGAGRATLHDKLHRHAARIAEHERRGDPVACLERLPQPDLIGTPSFNSSMRMMPPFTELSCSWTMAETGDSTATSTSGPVLLLVIAKKPAPEPPAGAGRLKGSLTAIPAAL